MTETDYEFVHQWTPEDVKRWKQHIKERDLTFADQVAIVQFIQDQQQHYRNLHADYTKVWNGFQVLRSKVSAFAPPIEGLIALARSNAPEPVLRAGLKFWTDQIMQDVLGRE